MRARLTKLVWSPLGLASTALLALVLASTLFYSRVEGWRFLEALSFVLATVTTVGYGNIYPKHQIGEIYTAGLMLVTLTSVVIVLSTFANRLIVLVSREESPMERNDRAVRALQDHIVVTASADLAGMIVQNLRSRQLPFIVITDDEAAHDRWLEEGVPTVHGDPDDEDSLLRAGIERARGLIVALEEDADNVFVTLSAHELNPSVRIICRAHSASSIVKLRRSGANEVVLPEQITAMNMVDLFRDPAHVSSAVHQAVAELRDVLRESPTAPAEMRNRPRQVLFRALRLALQELGPDMEETLYALGRQFGSDAVAPNLSGDALCDVLEAIIPVWSAAGLGSLQVAACTDTSARLVESECATCQGLPAGGRSVCHLERGILAGALEARLGRSVRARETKCRGLGDRACEFEVTVDVDMHRPPD